MYRLFEFIYAYRAFIIFVMLEVFCGYLIVSYNVYQSVAFLNSSNRYASAIMGTSSDLTTYLGLKQENERLAAENARLLEERETLKLALPLPLGPVGLDSLERGFGFIPAKVINASIYRTDNHITLNRGSEDGISPGMGVMNSAGPVGIVKAVSAHYSTVVSLLHTELLLSSKLKKNNVFGTVRWDGRSPEQSILLYIPRHEKPEVGDTVITSGFNNAFPEGITVGVISKVSIDPDDTFFDIQLKLSVDFHRLQFVYATRNDKAPEQDSLQNTLIRKQ